jgi:hypothetical protein
LKIAWASFVCRGINFSSLKRSSYMKKFLALILIILVAFSVGCVTDSSDDSGDENSGGNGDSGNGLSASAATYLPLVDGATWSYVQTLTSYWDTEPDISTETSTVTCEGTTTQNGKTYWSFEVEDEYYSSEFYMRIDGDNVYVLDPNWVFKTAVASKTAKRPVPARKTAEDEEVLVFKFNKSAGYTWTIEDDSGSSEGYSYTYKSTGKFYGLEDVTTAAGTFKDCARFDETIVDSYTYESETYGHTSTISRWLAPGVGFVKEKESFSADGSLSELIEVALTSYDLSGSASGGDGDGDDDGFYTISGTITDSSGNGIEDVLIDATAEIDGEDVVGNEFTDEQGNYVIERCRPGTWTIEPYESDYVFFPETKEVIVVAANVSGVDFAEAGGDGGGDGDGGDGGSGGPVGTSWQPLTDGSEWEWSSETVNYDGDQLYSDTYTIVSLFAVSKNGVDFQLMDNYDEWDDPYYRFDGDLLKIWWDDDSYVWFKPAVTAEDEGEAFTYYNFGASVGEEWSVFSYEGDSEDLTVTCVGKYLGTEDVTVTAGTFTGCAKMELTYTKLYNYTDLFTGEETSELIVKKSTHWFAKGVGEVKSYEVRHIDEELSDMTTNEVTSYTISE